MVETTSDGSDGGEQTPPEIDPPINVSGVENWMPTDGWDVRDHDAADGKISLWMEFVSCGETLVDYSFEVYSGDGSWQSYGERACYRLLWEGIAKFINAGGDWQVLIEDSAHLPRCLPSLDWQSQGITLAAVLKDWEYNPLLVFGRTEAKDLTEVLVWHEDHYAEWMPHTRLTELMEDEDDDPEDV